jgi:hypothetical protein
VTLFYFLAIFLINYKISSLKGLNIKKKNYFMADGAVGPDSK